MKKLPQKIIDKVIAFKTEKPQDITHNGERLGTWYIGELVGISEDFTHLQYISKGVFVKDDMVCWGGVCYNPKLMLGAKDTQQVIEAWKWFTSQLKIDSSVFENEIEKTAILEWVLLCYSTIYLPKILNLAVDLYRLNEFDVDISKKLHEINKNIKGNFKKAKKLTKKLEIDRQYKYSAHYLADIAAETRLAIVGKLQNYDTKLFMAHDLVLDDIKIQVKYLRKSNKISTILGLMDDGFTHGAQIVAINHDPDLNIELASLEKALNGKWLDFGNTLYYELDVAVELAKKSSRIVLFFTSTQDGYLARTLQLL